MSEDLRGALLCDLAEASRIYVKAIKSNSNAEKRCPTRIAESVDKFQPRRVGATLGVQEDPQKLIRNSEGVAGALVELLALARNLS